MDLALDRAWHVFEQALALVLGAHFAITYVESRLLPPKYQPLHVIYSMDEKPRHLLILGVITAVMLVLEVAHRLYPGRPIVHTVMYTLFIACVRLAWVTWVSIRIKPVALLVP